MLSDVTLSIVAYNSAQVLPACVASVPRECPILIFDNASRDDGALLAQRIRPDAHVLRSDTNIGFGNGHNRLLAQIKTPFALVLNPDAVLQADTLPALLQAAQENPKAAIIGAYHRAHAGHVEPSFYPFDKTLTDVTAVERISGAVMLLRMAAFLNTSSPLAGEDTSRSDEERGQGSVSPSPRPSPARGEGAIFFDPKIFLYFEDDDICAAVHQRGWQVMVQPKAHITHTPGRSSGRPSFAGTRRRYYHFAWSRCYFEDKQNGFDTASFNRFVRGMEAKLLKRLLVAVVTCKPLRIARFYGEWQGTRAYCRTR